MLEHGGRLRRAAERYGRPLAQWLDLSTGISALMYPLPALDSADWQRLPEEDDGLEAAARQCYGAQSLLPVAGSQAAIQILPQLLPAQSVAILAPSYAEHAHHWQLAGHRLHPFADWTELEARLPYCAVVVMVQPNNPTGWHAGRERLLALHRRLRARGGLLVVDEAFIDPTPQRSLADCSHRDGLVVLRSLGKFYGLAGARVGFVCAAPALLATLRERLGPWPLSGPSRAVARAALSDRVWQVRARRRLRQDSMRLAHLLGLHGLRPDGGTALFQWVRCDDAAVRHDRLARLGVLTRLYEAPAALRVGLPGSPDAWRTLAQALAQSAV